MTDVRISHDAKQDVDIMFSLSSLICAGPVHIAEQFLFGSDTLNELRDELGLWYSHFSNPDIGTVLLVIAGLTLIQSLLMETLAGGRWQLSVAGFFGRTRIREVRQTVCVPAQQET